MKEQEKIGYYAVIPANVRYDAELPPNAKLLYGEITALSSQSGYCWASNEYFANLYSCSKQSVSNWISKLRECGYIAIEYSCNDSSKRQIKVVECSPNDPLKVDDTTNFELDIQTLKKEFEKLWELYPRKAGKSSALKSYIQSRKKGTPYTVVESGLKAYAEMVASKKTDTKYIKYASTWFENECWKDKYNQHNAKPKPSKFNNYTDTNEVDYSNMSEQALDNVLNYKFD